MVSHELRVEVSEIEGQRHFGSTRFPYAFTNLSGEASTSEAERWLATRRGSILELAEEHGAVFSGASLRPQQKSLMPWSGHSRLKIFRMRNRSRMRFGGIERSEFSRPMRRPRK